jgi:hypothetical protein
VSLPSGYSWVYFLVFILYNKKIDRIRIRLKNNRPSPKGKNRNSSKI